MDIPKVITGIGVTATIALGGADASVLTEKPLDQVEIIKNERVEAKQIGNEVVTTFPWKDQTGIKVKYDMGKPTISEKLKDKRNKQVVTERVNFADDGGFKIDIILDKKPDTNVFCYAIEGAENYDFFYQPALTPQQIIDGDTQPENIAGSYAVYHKTLKNHVVGKTNYETGKVMHIPRPQVWEVDDATNTKQWADLSYDNEQLCVTAPQSFLDKATYPVRVDPTFGYTSFGASAATFDANWAVGSFVNNLVTSNGTVEKVSVAALDNIGTSRIKGFVTDDGPTTWTILTNGIGTEVDPPPTTAVWLDSTMNTPPSVSASTNYHAWVVIGNNSSSIKRDTGTSGDSRYESDNTYSTPTNPNTLTNSTGLYSIYATYTESGGGGGTPPVIQSETWF